VNLSTAIIYLVYLEIAMVLSVMFMTWWHASQIIWFCQPFRS